MKRLLLLTTALLAFSQIAHAQPAPLGGGSQIQQIPRSPEAPQTLPDIRIERGQAPATAEPAGPRIVVKTLHVTGETQFTEADLIAATGFHPGLETDLAGLRAMAARISDFYGRHGYFVAQAYLPAQTIEAGAVTIVVIEGHYGKVGLNNSAHVSDHLARSVLAGLDPGDIVASAPLERRLLLLSDLPGVRVASTLRPGEAVGTSDLLVNLTPGRRVTGSLEADNAGNPYTGEWRGGGTVNFNEPFGIGDVASLRYLTAGDGLNYVRAAYQARVQDATLGVSYAFLDYHLGRQFAPLDARGTLNIASVFASYPLIRSRDSNLYVLVDFDAKMFRDTVGATHSVIDRRIGVVNFGLSGDHHDHFLGGGWTTFTITGSVGDLDIRTPLTRATDAVTARSNGSYEKLSFDVTRLQQFAGPLSFYGEARGQLASKNLDSSEKMELGGAYGVRAFPEGEAYGDEGYILTLEARLRLGTLGERIGGHLQASAFVDYGEVKLNEDPWFSGPNDRTLSAAGVGLTWTDRRNLMLKVSYAFALSGHATSFPDHGGHLWLQLSKFF